MGALTLENLIKRNLEIFLWEWDFLTSGFGRSDVCWACGSPSYCVTSGSLATETWAQGRVGV